MSEGLIGAMIGAAAAIFGGLLGEMLKNHYSMAKMNIEKKSEAYIEAMKYCLAPVVPATEISEESENNDTAAPSPLLIERFLSIYDGDKIEATIALYGSNSVREALRNLRDAQFHYWADISISSENKSPESLKEYKSKKEHLINLLRKEMKS